MSGISVEVFDPLLFGGAKIIDLTDTIPDYSHTKSADMGFVSASISFDCKTLDFYDWLNNGLLRHIEVKNAAQQTVWEGFVDGLSGNIAGTSYTRGPVSDIGNRVYAIYTPLYTITGDSGSTLIRGNSMETALVNNTLSQSRYGIIEKALNAGTCIVNATNNDADIYRNNFLAEMAYPKTNTPTSSASKIPRITLDCVGYWKLLDWYVWNNRATAAALGYATINNKIIAILNGNPNGWGISSDRSQIFPNTAILPNREAENQTGLTLIKEAMSAGDVNGNRWLFGIGAKRVPYYHVVPTEVEYEYRIVDTEQRLFFIGSNVVVEPWDIEPGRWYQSLDHQIVPSGEGTNFRDLKKVFIESVNFKLPYSFDLAESKITTLAQILAYKNLGLGV